MKLSGSVKTAWLCTTQAASITSAQSLKKMSLIPTATSEMIDIFLKGDLIISYK